MTEARIVAAALRHDSKLILNTESALAATPRLGTNGQSASCSGGLAAAVAMPYEQRGDAHRTAGT